MIREVELQRYQEYLAFKRQNITPELGHFATEIFLSPFTFNIIEPGVARGIPTLKENYEAPTIMPDYRNKLGELSARNVIYADFDYKQALYMASKSRTLQDSLAS